MRHKPSLWHRLTGQFDPNCDYSGVPCGKDEIDFNALSRQAEAQGNYKKPFTQAAYRIAQGCGTQKDADTMNLLKRSI